MNWEFLTKEQRTTQKPYPCEWCGQPIDAGTRCLSFRGVYAGDFTAGRMHPECEAAWDRLEAGDEFDLRGMRRGKDEPY